MWGRRSTAVWPPSSPFPNIATTKKKRPRSAVWRKVRACVFALKCTHSCVVSARPSSRDAPTAVPLLGRVSGGLVPASLPLLPRCSPLLSALLARLHASQVHHTSHGTSPSRRHAERVLTPGGSGAQRRPPRHVRVSNTSRYCFLVNAACDHVNAAHKGVITP